MVRIKRTKKSPVPAVVLPPAVHYAVSVAPAGNVTLWTPEVGRAGSFDATVAEKALKFYRCRENAGVLSLESVQAPVLEPVQASVPPIAAATEETVAPEQAETKSEPPAPAGRTDKQQPGRKAK
jgi:hypothetical protein